MADLIVKPLATKKTDLPQSPYMKKGIINRFPSMLLNIGKSGSGKSTVVSYMLTEANYMKDFFHKVYMFSPTAELDDLVKHLKLKKEFLITDPTEEEVMKILDSQEALIKRQGIEQTGLKSRVLIIFDDIVSNQNFLKSPAMLRIAAMGRHFLVSSIINTQSYTKIPRAIRLQANALILFPSSNNEVNLLIEDLAPPHTSKKDFAKVIEYCTKDRHSFMFVNNFEPPETRFRKGFLQIVEAKKTEVYGATPRRPTSLREAATRAGEMRRL